MARDDRRVLISGGGPVGLLCAWMLGRRGIGVRLFDNNPSLQADPRAATTHPATLELLGEVGLADDMARVGLVAPIFQFGIIPRIGWWRNLIIPFSPTTRHHPFVVQCEQFKTSSLLLERVRTLSDVVEVMFDHEVVDLRQSTNTVSVDVRGPDGIKTHSGVLSNRR